MLSWFRKKQALAEVRNAPVEEPMVHYVHERKRLPDEGAQSYAFETLQLAVHSPIDAAVRVRYRNGGSSIGVAFPQLEGQQWINAAVPVNGIPSMSGGIYGTRQFTPDGAQADLGSAATINMFALQTNNPRLAAGDVNNMAFINDPFPQGGGGRGSMTL